MKIKIWNIKDIINVSSEFLKTKNIETSRLDAEILLCDILNMERIQLYLNFDRPLQKSELSKYREYIKRRSLKEPVAYIIKKKEFMSLNFYVNKNVLIPRPETELIVEYIKQKYSNNNVSILDIGTGSGAIAISLKKYIPNINIVATDISLDALMVSSKNAKTILGENEISFICCDTKKAILRSFDIIISNPPYITENEYKDLNENVKNYEPKNALLGGKDGLDIYKKIANSSNLKNTKEIILEISGSICDNVCNIFKEKGFKKQNIIKDLAGHKRVLCCVQ